MQFFGAAVQQFTRFRLTRGVAIAQLLVRGDAELEIVSPPTGNTSATTGRDGGTPEEKPIRGTAVTARAAGDVGRIKRIRRPPLRVIQTFVLGDASIGERRNFAPTPRHCI